MKNFLPKNSVLHPLYCDKKGTVYEYPEFEPAFRSGREFVRVDPEELIPLPEGSVLFSLPERHPVIHDSQQDTFTPVSHIDQQEIWAASAFLSSGYLRTYLPAYQNMPGSPALTLWAYCGIAASQDQFLVPALRIDDDPRSNPEIHTNDKELMNAIADITAAYPENRLIKQLAFCSTEYRCLCARNFFLSRYEAPIPTSPSCNANCAGCLSSQTSPGFKSSHARLDFKPDPEEIAEAIVHHVTHVKNAVASFGQGCEGEPLLRGTDLATAISKVRAKTDCGTININTNGSLPDMVSHLIYSGLDSIRISMNSPSKHYYDRYYRQTSYSHSDVLKSVELALQAGIYVSLNLFFMPGFTDSEEEAESLINFLKHFPINMIQTRNLNIDPDFYLDLIDFKDTTSIGIRKLLKLIKNSFPNIKLGYYNPPKENRSL